MSYIKISVHFKVFLNIKTGRVITYVYTLFFLIQNQFIPTNTLDGHLISPVYGVESVLWRVGLWWQGGAGLQCCRTRGWAEYGLQAGVALHTPHPGTTPVSPGTPAQPQHAQSAHGEPANIALLSYPATGAHISTYADHSSY